MHEAAVQSALAKVRPSLDADGFDLNLRSLTPEGAVEVVLAARPDACLDCLVPDEMLVQIIETAIRAEAADLCGVTLVKEGFETVAGH
jgi:Fe-S cluster biogenesis protein NfuA